MVTHTLSEEDEEKNGSLGTLLMMEEPVPGTTTTWAGWKEASGSRQAALAQTFTHPFHSSTVISTGKVHLEGGNYSAIHVRLFLPSPALLLGTVSADEKATTSLSCRRKA